MEYNLQKTLDFDINYESTNDFNIDLFEDFMPGIGQIVPFDNIIVPLYNHSDLTTITKVITLDTPSVEKSKKNVSKQLPVQSQKMSFKKHKFKIY